MSIQNRTDASNSGYVSSEETDSLLISAVPKTKSSVLRSIKMNSANGPTSNNSSVASSKPTLMRQDRTSTYITSPQLSQQPRLGSDESERASMHDDDVELGLRPSPVPDIEVYPEDSDSKYTCKQTQQQNKLTHYQPNFVTQQQPTISITNLNNLSYQIQDNEMFGTTSYQCLSSDNSSSNVANRCRTCKNCSRRASTTPFSTIGHLDRSTSGDSVKSAFPQGNLGASTIICCGSGNVLLHNIPPVLITASPPNGSRIIRQSSQPESSSSTICYGIQNSCGHSHTVPNVSLKQLRDSNIDGIAGIAADSLRINGGMRPFKQVLAYKSI